jgi:hypothetical protein
LDVLINAATIAELTALVVSPTLYTAGWHERTRMTHTDRYRGSPGQQIARLGW